MVDINKCVNDTAEAFKDAFDKEDVQNLADELKDKIRTARKNGDDLTNLLFNERERLQKEKEEDLIGEKIRLLHNIEDISEIFLRAIPFEQGGFENPTRAASISALYGSKYKSEKARDNADTDMFSAGTSAVNRIMKRFHDENLYMDWMSPDLQNEIQIAKEIENLSFGRPASKTSAGRIAEIAHEELESLDTGRLEQGLITSKLPGRIMGTIHDENRILEVNRKERKHIKQQAEKLRPDNPKAPYDRALIEYTYQRWKNFILPLLDHKRTFDDRNIDSKDAQSVDNVMRSVYDNLINSDKKYSEQLDLVRRYKAQRFLIFDGAEPTIKYNRKYGSGTMQQAITNELQRGFGILALVKRWGHEPIETLKKVHKAWDKSPIFKNRLDKSKDFEKDKKALMGLMHGVFNPLDGVTGTIFNAVRAFEAAVHLKFVTLKSIPDLGSLAQEAKYVGHNVFDVMGDAISNLMKGMSEEDKKQFGEITDALRITHNGAINSMFPDNSNKINNLSQKLLKTTLKLNGIERWDWAMRTAVHAMYGRWFAMNKHVDWEGLTDKDRGNLELYGIDKTHYEIIRQSGTRAIKGKNVIMPDSVRFMDDEKIKDILRKQGESDSPRNLRRMKDSVETKLRTYFTDRADHVVQRPNVRDQMILNFGGISDTWPKPLQAIFRMFSMFKSFGVAYATKNIPEALFKNGARNIKEALLDFGGKGGLGNFAGLAIKMLAFTYLSKTVENLLNGFSPPDLKHSQTWLDMLQDIAGMYGSWGGEINPHDLAGSLGKMMFGSSGLGDVQNIANLGSKYYNRMVNGAPANSTDKAWWSVLHNLVPDQFLIHPITNAIILNRLHNSLDPSGVQKNVEYMQNTYGSSQL